MAWRMFLDRYGSLIATVAFRAGAVSRSDGEEVYQRTVLAIYERLGGLKKPDRIVAWISGIARYQALSYLRKRGREVGGWEEHLSEPDETVPLPPDELESLQRNQILLEALSDLRPRCRDLLKALYLHEKEASYKEIERAQGIPFGSIGPTRARCLECLRAALQKRGFLGTSVRSPK